MSRDFYELCNDQYKREMSEADSLYQRASIMFLVLPFLATVLSALARIDILPRCFTRVDIFLYYLAALVGIIFLVISVWFLFLCIYPRGYKTLANMDAWHEWRTKYEEHLKNEGDGNSGSDPNALDEAMFENLCPRLVEAQPGNAKINETRRKAFRRSILMAGIALIAVGVQALFHLILKVQGV